MAASPDEGNECPQARKKPRSVNPRKAMALAIVVGFFGFMGLGHMYAGFKKRGQTFFILFFILIFIFSYFFFSWIFSVAVPMMLLMAGVWIYHIIDLKRLLDDSVPVNEPAHRPESPVNAPEPYSEHQESGEPPVNGKVGHGVPLDHIPELGKEFRNPLDMWTAISVVIVYLAIPLLAVFGPTISFLAPISAPHYIFILSFSTLLSTYIFVIRRPRSIVIKKDGVLLRFRFHNKFLRWGEIEYIVDSRPLVLDSRWSVEEGLIKPYRRIPYRVRCSIVREVRSACRTHTGYDLKNIRMDIWGKDMDKGRIRIPSKKDPYELFPRKKKSNVPAQHPDVMPASEKAAKRPAEVVIDEKNRTVAYLLSIVMGWGHLYAGNIRKGFLFGSLFILLVLAFPFLGPLEPEYVAILVGVFIIIWCAQVIDAGMEVGRYNTRMRALALQIFEEPAIPVMLNDDPIVTATYAEEESRMEGMRKALENGSFPVNLNRPRLILDSLLLISFIAIGLTISFLSPGSLFRYAFYCMAGIVVIFVIYMQAYRRPRSVSVSTEGVCLRFHIRTDRFLLWDEIIWMGGQDTGMLTFMRNEGRIRSTGSEWYDMPVEALKLIEEGYLQKKGETVVPIREHR